MTLTATRPKPRRYTRRQKMTAVIAAEMTSTQQASDTTGIPRKTLAYWMDTPEFAELRRKTREDLAEESQALAHKTLGEIQRRLAEFEPRDLTILYGVLTDKAQLLAGHATGRIETKTLTDGMDDHERATLRKLLDDALAEPAGVPA